jgi:hypothetical protein
LALLRRHGLDSDRWDRQIRAALSL